MNFRETLAVITAALIGGLTYTLVETGTYLVETLKTDGILMYLFVIFVPYIGVTTGFGVLIGAPVFFLFKKINKLSFWSIVATPTIIWCLIVGSTFGDPLLNLPQFVAPALAGLSCGLVLFFVTGYSHIRE